MVKIVKVTYKIDKTLLLIIRKLSFTNFIIPHPHLKGGETHGKINVQTTN